MINSNNTLNFKWILILGLVALIASSLNAQVCNPSPGIFTQKPCLHVKDVITNDTFCNGDTYTWVVNNNTYSLPGTYSVATTDNNDCDYNEVLNLFVFQQTNNIVTNDTFCQGSSYTWAVNNVTYSNSGSYAVSLIDENGCPYNALLNLAYDVKGCTDPNASNYNPNAVCDDGSCFVNPLGCICGEVWLDANNNGLQDPGENMIADITVELYDQSSQIISTDLTTNTGSYCFTGLPDDTYQIKFNPILNSQFAMPNVGANDALDSDPNASGIVFVDVVNEVCNTNTDAGLVPDMSIGSTVFLDVNNNGIQDPGESGIPGMSVELYTASSVFVASTTTDASGNYYFGGIPPGAYFVRVIPSATYPISSFDVSTTSGDNGVDGDDNGIQPTFSSLVNSPIISLFPNTEPINESGQGGNQDNLNDSNGDMTIDFGFVQLGGQSKTGNKN